MQYWRTSCILLLRDRAALATAAFTPTLAAAALATAALATSLTPTLTAAAFAAAATRISAHDADCLDGQLHRCRSADPWTV